MGKELKSPILLAPAMYNTFVGWFPKFAHKIAKAGWGGIVAKNIVTDDVRVGFCSEPALWTTRIDTPVGKRMKEGMALVNAGPDVEYYSEKKLDDPAEEMWRISKERMKKGIEKAHEEGLVVIGNFSPTGPENAVRIAKLYEECGYDGLEFNSACPMIHELGMGAFAVGVYTEKLQEIVKAVKEATSLPLMVKLSPHTLSFPDTARAVVKAGADAVSAINTVLSIIGLDVETGYPLSRSADGGFSSPCGYSGPPIKPIGLRAVWEIARSVKTQVSGIGGAHDWKSVVEYMMVGATTVQLSTAPMFKGLGVGREILDGMIEFMKRKGYTSVHDFIGMSVSRIVPVGVATFTSAKPAVGVVDTEKCTGCRRCEIVCDDNCSSAAKVIDGKAVIDDNLCLGCGLCSVVCPVECISYKPITMEKKLEIMRNFHRQGE
ncbi:MAG: 4Fe-4S dicluster-binding protein [Candidatus Hadarchaeum sp.]|uniref:4Fe-4S dicluster-binding protein n=1 Tax=Candidatus Hadarchaeum sp. TaxID=2883567 RepID=UPI003D12824E